MSISKINDSDWSKLPEGPLADSFSYLGIADLFSASETCRAWKKAAEKLHPKSILRFFPFANSLSVQSGTFLFSVKQLACRFTLWSHLHLSPLTPPTCPIAYVNSTDIEKNLSDKIQTYIRSSQYELLLTLTLETLEQQESLPFSVTDCFIKTLLDTLPVHHFLQPRPLKKERVLLSAVVRALCERGTTVSPALFDCAQKNLLLALLSETQFIPAFAWAKKGMPRDALLYRGQSIGQLAEPTLLEDAVESSFTLKSYAAQLSTLTPQSHQYAEFQACGIVHALSDEETEDLRKRFERYAFDPIPSIPSPADIDQRFQELLESASQEELAKPNELGKTLLEMAEELGDATAAQSIQRLSTT